MFNDFVSEKPATVLKRVVALQVTKDHEWPTYPKIYMEIDYGGSVVLPNPEAQEAARRALREAATPEERARLEELDVIQWASLYQIRFGQNPRTIGTVWTYGARRELSIIKPEREYVIPYIQMPARWTAGDCFDFKIQTNDWVKLKFSLDPHHYKPEGGYRWVEVDGDDGVERRCRSPLVAAGRKNVEALVYGHILGNSDGELDILVLRPIKTKCEVQVELVRAALGGNVKGTVAVGSEQKAVDVALGICLGFSFEKGLSQGTTLPVSIRCDVPVYSKISASSGWDDENFAPAFELVRHRSPK
jgi:hypothetical protein